MSARDPLYDSPNPHRLYRNPENGILFGVCAGLGDYLGVHPWKIRILVLIALVALLPATIVAYVVAAVLLPRRPRQVAYGGRDEERFWRAVSGRPRDTFHGLRHEFRAMEQRLAELERVVTSPEFKLDREIRDLG